MMLRILNFVSNNVSYLHWSRLFIMIGYVICYYNVEFVLSRNFFYTPLINLTDSLVWWELLSVTYELVRSLATYQCREQPHYRNNQFSNLIIETTNFNFEQLRANSTLVSRSFTHFIIEYLKYQFSWYGPPSTVKLAIHTQIRYFNLIFTENTCLVSSFSSKKSVGLIIWVYCTCLLNNTWESKSRELGH